MKKLEPTVFPIVLMLMLPAPTQSAPTPVESLVAQLTSDDTTVADGAKRQLKEMGDQIVAALFEKLLVADWTLRPRLLEVLSAHGREFAKQKLKDGSDTERIYAALVYELSVACAADEHDYESPEFKGMVAALLRAIQSEDKNLRAAAGAALVYDEESTVFFDHLHEIVPALISSFDTELLIDRCVRCAPAEVVMIVIGNNLTVLVGERFVEIEREVFFRPTGAEADAPRDPQASMGKFLADNRSRVDRLRVEWETWWRQHSKLSAIEIGALMIERSLRVLPADRPTRSNWDTMTADWCLRKWTGSLHFEWGEWWAENKTTYQGPIKRRE